MGSSSAMNCVGVVKTARMIGAGHTIVTILCDGGARSLSKVYNKQFLKEHELLPESNDDNLTFVK